MKNEFGITIVAVEKIGQRDALRLTGEHPKHVSKPSLYPKKIMTVRSTAGLIRYLALQFGSTIVQNFHSRRPRIRLFEIFLLTETSFENFTKIGNSVSPANLKIHLLFRINFLRTQKILSYFFDLLFHIELLHYQLRNRFRSKP